VSWSSNCRSCATSPSSNPARSLPSNDAAARRSRRYSPPAGFRHGDALNPAVGVLPLARDETRPLHRVEVMGQRRLPDADRRGEVGLGPVVTGRQRPQHLPGGSGAAGGDEDVVEGPAHLLGDAADQQAERVLVERHAAILGA